MRKQFGNFQTQLSKPEEDNKVRLLKNKEGSITLEAALIIPIFLSFILLLSSFVKISIAEISLQKAVDETVQTSAHYAYLGLAVQGLIDDTGESFIGALTDSAKGAMDNDTVAKYLLDKLVDQVKGEIPSSGDVVNHFSDGLFETLVKEKYEKYVPSSSFYNPGGIKVLTSHYTTATSGDSADIVVEVENTLKLVLPFYQKDIKIKKIGIERGWVGN